MALSGVLELLNSCFQVVYLICLGLGPPGTAWGCSPVLSHHTLACSKLPLVLVRKAVISPFKPRFTQNGALPHTQGFNPAVLVVLDSYNTIRILGQAGTGGEKRRQLSGRSHAARAFVFFYGRVGRCREPFTNFLGKCTTLFPALMSSDAVMPYCASGI